MNSSVELKEEITFDEFKAWMNGLLRGTGKNCPGPEDWRAIYKMMDKVVPDKEEIITQQPTYVPTYTPPEDKWYKSPKITDSIIPPTYVGDLVPNPWEVTCSHYGYESTQNTISISSDTPLQTSSIAPSSEVFKNACDKVGVDSVNPYMPYEESETVKGFFEDIETVRQEMYKLTGIKGKE